MNLYRFCIFKTIVYIKIYNSELWVLWTLNWLKVASVLIVGCRDRHIDRIGSVKRTS